MKNNEFGLLSPLPSTMVIPSKNSLMNTSALNLEEVKELDKYIEFLNILEGFKTKTKNLHWAAESFNNHKLLDKFLNILSDYQDSLAEESMGIYGKMSNNVIKGCPCECSNPLELISNIKKKVETFYSSLHDEVSLVGIKSETETFIHNINKYNYLFSLCK